MKIYYVYILTNKYNGALYIGVTGDIKKRMNEHRNGTFEGFTKKYDLKRLVYMQGYQYISEAIYNEKRLKRWHRSWKINLIEQFNPRWSDLSENFMDPETLRQAQGRLLRF